MYQKPNPTGILTDVHAKSASRPNKTPPAVPAGFDDFAIAMTLLHMVAV
jgi:hypothetical protein